MPRFVQSVANQQMPPPYFFPDVKAHTFCFEVPMQSVQDLCDRYFNLGGARERGFMYRPFPLMPYGMLMILQYPVMITKERDILGEEIPLFERGYAQQNEVFVALPVVRHGTRLSNVVTNAALEWTLPFIAVDNATSAFSGREILGLDKLHADIAIGPGDYLRSLSAHVTVPGWRSLDPNAMQEDLDFLTITTGPTAPYPSRSPRQKSVWTTLGGPYARKSLEVVAAVAEGVEALTAGMIPTAMRIVALKQFRDAEDPRKAVYQALVGARTRYVNIHDVRFYNENDVSITFHNNGSLDEIVRTVLGASASDADPTRLGIQVTAKAACTFTADIQFDDMMTLHSFPVDGEDKAAARADPGSMVAPWLKPWVGLWTAPPRRTAP